MKWFGLSWDGTLEYLGEYDFFDEAEETNPENMWLISEVEAQQWREVLNGNY